MGSAVSGLTLALGVFAALAWACVTGLPVRSAVLALLMTLVTQIVPGALIWRAVRPREGWFLEDVIMGFAVGAGLGAAAQVIAGSTRHGWLAVAIPIMVGSTLLLMPAARARVTHAQWSATPWWTVPVLMVATLPSVLQLHSWYAMNQVQWGARVGTPDVDVYFQVSLAGELLHRGPSGWPLVLGEPLDYHWFTHAWVAQVSAVSGAGVDEIILRFMPALMPLALVLAVWAVTMRLINSSGFGVLAALLTTALGSASFMAQTSQGLPTTPASPTLAMGAFPLLALVTLYALRWRGELTGAAYALVPFLFVFATGTKGSTGPLIVAGLSVAVAAMLVANRPKLRVVLLDWIVAVVCLLVTVKLVFGDSSGGLSFGIGRAAGQTLIGITMGTPLQGAAAILAAGLAVALAAARGAGLLAMACSRQWRRQPITWLLIGGSLAGAGAIGAFSHPGASQHYFLLTALPLMGIGSAVGLHTLARAQRPRFAPREIALALVGGAGVFFVPAQLVGGPYRGEPQRVLVMLILGLGLGLLTLCAAYLMERSRPSAQPATLRTRLRSVGFVGVAATLVTCLLAYAMVAGRGRVIDQPASIRANRAVSQSDIDASRYIRDHSPVDAIVMTNRHCAVIPTPSTTCEVRRWVVTAFSERQAYIESWGYTAKAAELAPSGRQSLFVPFWRPAQLRLNDEFYTHPTVASWRKLWAIGVRWVYVDKLAPHSGLRSPYAALRFNGKDAQAWQLLPPPA